MALKDWCPSTIRMSRLIHAEVLSVLHIWGMRAMLRMKPSVHQLLCCSRDTSLWECEPDDKDGSILEQIKKKKTLFQNDNILIIDTATQLPDLSLAPLSTSILSSPQRVRVASICSTSA